MNPIPYQTAPSLPNWFPVVPPNPPPSSTFWNKTNVHDRLRELQDTLNLAKAMKKELEMLMKVKEAKECARNEGNGGSAESIVNLDEFSKFIEDNRIDSEAHETVAVEAANELMSRLTFLLDPFKVVTDETVPWEEKSAAVRMSDKIKKSKRNKLWRKKKRKHVAQMIAKEREKFEELDREADEWRAREIAKTIAQRKVEKMKEIAKQKAKEEKKRLESELELVLIVEKLQELRSMRIEKLKKQGHFLPEEDDKFLERVQAAVEEEERQARAAADTDAAKDAIATAEESRKVIHGGSSDPKDQTSKGDLKGSQDQILLYGSEGGSATVIKESGNQGTEGPSYGAYDYVANLPLEFYHYYHGSNTDMGTLIEVRRTWDAYIRPGGSRIPGHWVQPPTPADEIWASCLIQPK